MYYLLIIIGIVAYASIIFSFLTGMKIVKVKYKIHKWVGIIGFSIASVHAFLMLYFNVL